MRIALFKSLSGEWTSTFEESKRHLYDGDDYVRISGWVEVEFPPLQDADINLQIDGLTAQIDVIDRELQERRSARLLTLAKRRAILLTLRPGSSAESNVTAIR